MNPRHRRLLIPGLLVILIVVVVVASLVRRAEAAEPVSASDGRVAATEVSRLGDDRISESSGLAVSRRHQDLAYTINDSGNDPQVFAIEISTGRTVGVTTVTGTSWVDPEALALDGDGGLWVGDVGDNRAVRRDVALYRIDEPGRGDRRASAEVHPLTYDGGPVDVESLAVDPESGRMLLVTKELSEPRVLELPDPLPASGSATPTPLDWSGPALATDASWVPGTSRVVVRTYDQARVIDARTGEEVRSFVLPPQEQGETVAVEPSGRTMLVGSEGEGSALLRVDVDPAAGASPSAVPSGSEDGEDSAVAWSFGLDTTVLKGFAVVLIVVGTALALRALWRRRRDGGGLER